MLKRDLRWLTEVPKHYFGKDTHAKLNGGPTIAQRLTAESFHTCKHTAKSHTQYSEKSTGINRGKVQRLCNMTNTEMYHHYIRVA